MAKHPTGKCVICKKLQKKTLEQLMGQIPKLRVAAGFPAFSNIHRNAWTSAGTTWTKNAERSTCNYIHLHDNQSSPS